MVSLFLLSVLFCCYTYAIFPLLLHWRARPYAREAAAKEGSAANVPDSGRVWPGVSVVIAAHNELQRLPIKMESLRALDYPADRLQIVVVSDGSTDGTAEYLEQLSDVDSDHYEPAAGKPTALNRAMELCKGEIVVFMDARQRVSANTIKSLVPHFDDNEVGAVSGELVLSDNGQTEATNVGLYWRYEKWIRQNESLLFSTTGATGALYAIRKNDAVVLPVDTLLDDFITPIETLKHGKRTIFETGALAFDEAEEDSGREFQRKARTLAGNYQAFARQSWLFSPRRNPVFWQFLSHKVFRLLVPYAMLLAFLASVIGSGGFLKLMFWLQVVFYGAGIAGFLLPKSVDNKLLNFIKVFLQLNAAAVVGAYRYLTGKAAVRWKASQ